jgi:uncharacterized phage protein gp47/JayE
MSAPNIDDLGFHVLGFDGWKARLIAQYQSEFGTDIDLGPDSPDGQWLAILAGDFADIEQLAQVDYEGRSPAGAVGVGLSRLVQLNGITRKPAQFSSLPISIAGTVGTVVATGKLIGDPNDATLPAFQVRAPGITIGGGGTGTGFADCTVAGPINVATNRLTKILEPVTGWATVTNTSTATPGTLVESDLKLRARRAKSAAIPSQSMLDGLEAAHCSTSPASRTRGPTRTRPTSRTRRATLGTASTRSSTAVPMWTSRTRSG